MKVHAVGILMVATSLMAAGTVQAADSSKILGGTFSFNGLVRLETAISTSNEAPKANQYGDPANGKTLERHAGNPADGFATTIDPPGTPIIVPGTTRGVTATSASGGSDIFTRYVPAREPEMNYHVLRFEASPTLSWGTWSIQSRIRALYDPGDLGYRDFDHRDYDDINGGVEGGYPREYHSTPDFFGYQVDGEKNPILFERSGRHYMVDFPALFLQWTNGNLTARLGNQSVAWGQLLFFRVMDVANGLDLRRHLFLDRAIEEYADERMSAPGLRVTWQATDTIIVDTFAQQFIPTVLPNANTPYNVVASQFLLHDRYKQFGYDEKINYGIRVKGEYGNYNLQAMATSRLNPLGSINWTESRTNKPLPSTNALGRLLNGFCESPGYTGPGGPSPAGQGCGPQLAQLPFEVAPVGLFSAEQWFDYAGYTRLDALEGFDSVIRDFPVSTFILAAEVDGNINTVNNELDTFFIAGEGLRAHIQRKYFREEVYGLGGGYVIEAEPGSIFDQMIINVEATYTSGRTITAPALPKDPVQTDDMQVGLVLEKWQRFSQNFPATYMVFQYLWQKNTDLVGLSLDGYGSENFTDQSVFLDGDVPTSTNPKIVPGINSANYLVFAFLQPTDAYIFEFSTAALVDVQGGVLVQPAVQWKPRGNITVNVFYNYLNGNAWGKNPNKNLISFLEFADELAIRVGYQF